MSVPLTVWRAADVRFPSAGIRVKGTPAELRALHTVRGQRTAELNEVALQMAAGGGKQIWRSAIDDFRARGGSRLKASSARAALETAFVGTKTITTVAKLFRARPRPFRKDPTLTPEGKRSNYFSFPSGHAATAAAGAAVLKRLWPSEAATFTKASWNIADSRPYLGVHYFSDIRAGHRVGSPVGALAYRVFTPAGATAAAGTGVALLAAPAQAR